MLFDSATSDADHLKDLDAVRRDLERLYSDGYRSVAIVFVHSYTFPEHEQQVGALAREVGFTHVSESARLLKMIRIKRDITSCG